MRGGRIKISSGEIFLFFSMTLRRNDVIVPFCLKNVEKFYEILSEDIQRERI